MVRLAKYRWVLSFHFLASLTRSRLALTPSSRLPTPISYLVFSISYLLLFSLRNFPYRDGRSPLSSIFRDSRNFLSLKIASTNVSPASHRYLTKNTGMKVVPSFRNATLMYPEVGKYTAVITTSVGLISAFAKNARDV